MRVLAITINYVKQQEALIRALKGLCTTPDNFHYLDWMKYQKENGDLSSHIEHLNNKINPDLTFIQVQTPGIIRNMKLKGFVVNWTGDARQPMPGWFEEAAKCADVTCFSNETDVQTFKEKNLPSEYLQIGFDDHIFKPEGKIRPTQDVVFMGNNYGDTFTLGTYRRDMVKVLRDEFEGKFGVYGSGWKYAQSIMYNYELEAEIYRSCKMAINLSHYDLERYTSDRMYRLMGSGALCLTKAYPGLNKDFKDEKNVVIWYDLEDLKNKIWYYLENTEEASEIAKNGCELVHSKHRWENRMDDVIRIKQKYDKKGN